MRIILSFAKGIRPTKSPFCRILLDCKRYKNTSCFSTGYIQQEGCCQLNMCVAGSASTLTCYQTNFHQATNEADFNNSFFAKSLVIEFQ